MYDLSPSHIEEKRLPGLPGRTTRILVCRTGTDGREVRLAAMQALSLFGLDRLELLAKTLEVVSL